MNEPVVAPIAGIVWKILVNEGDSVILGQSLILLESMKMEVPAHSPAAGVVATIRVRAGDAVEDGDELATICVGDL
jgi:biotin carboxyl carrier protein